MFALPNHNHQPLEEWDKGGDKASVPLMTSHARIGGWCCGLYLAIRPVAPGLLAVVGRSLREGELVSIGEEREEGAHIGILSARMFARGVNARVSGRVNASAARMLVD